MIYLDLVRMRQRELLRDAEEARAARLAGARDARRSTRLGRLTSRSSPTVAPRT
ncbi:MAG: hypothetical protein M3N29_05060 [Chloroflexota bacterium]|nr:hypothetical protein [Chloroflexota bacterium]